MTLSERRLSDQIRFYEILEMLDEQIGGARVLAGRTGRVL